MSRGRQVRAPLSPEQREEADRIVESFVGLRSYLKRVSECFVRAQRSLREARARKPRDSALIAAHERELSTWRGLFDDGLAAVYGPAKTLDQRLDQTLVIRHLDEAVACVERLLDRPARASVDAALRRGDRARLASHVRAVLLLDGGDPGPPSAIRIDVHLNLAQPPPVAVGRRTRESFLRACAVVAELTDRRPVPLERLVARHRKKDRPG